MIGIDIEKIRRFKLNKKDKFLSENFTKKELKYAYSKTKPEVHLCGIFCAKEALIKTLNGPRITFKQIEVSHNKSNKPLIRLLNKKNRFQLSISHCGDYAVAIVIKK